MRYEETLEYLYTQLPMYQRIGKSAYKKDLNNTLFLLKCLDNPHRAFKSIHIAGTNGKGTSAHGIAAILQTAGYNTGLYTSPHLKHFTERIKINGKEINPEYMVSFVERIKPFIAYIQPSFFEITVAMAFDYFAYQKVDIAVIETGLGGRLDSTNVIIPEISLITNISYDHTDILGDTLEKIAYEKAGIIKKGVPVAIGEVSKETKPIFEKKSLEMDTHLIFPTPMQHWLPHSSYIPNYLIKNYPGIYTVIDQLIKKGWAISDHHISDGIENTNELTGLKGRFQILKLRPLMIADVSHNIAGLKTLFEQIETINEGRLHLIFGTIKGKNLKPIFGLFPKGAKIYWTQSSVPRTLPVETLRDQALESRLEGETFMHVNRAIAKAKEEALPQDTILITGSTFVIAEIDNL